MFGPSDWIRTSGQPTSSGWPPGGGSKRAFGAEAAGSGCRYKKQSTCFFKQVLCGPSDWIRTSGLLNPIQARYQTSPHPDIFFFTAVGVTQAAYIDYHRPQENASLFFNFFNLFFRGNQPVQNSLSPLRRKAFSCCHLQEDREAPGGCTTPWQKEIPAKWRGFPQRVRITPRCR